jgi:AcrR family transcriptional regulator
MCGYRCFVARSQQASARRDPTVRAPVDLAHGRTYSERHVELLDGLETIVLTEGFRSLTIGGLAERLQCSRRTLYEIAESKDQIVLVVVDRLLRRLARRAHDAALAEQTVFERILAFLVKGLVELQRARLSFAEDVADAPAVHDLVDSHFHYAIGEVAGLLQQGIEDGEFANFHPILVAEMLYAGVVRLLEPRVLRAAGVGLADALEEFLTLFLDGIRASDRSDRFT